MAIIFIGNNLICLLRRTKY